MTTANAIMRAATPVRQQVEDLLREAILGGEFQSGDRLVERDLCDRFGVSRPLMREALRQMEAEMLITREPHRGLKVTVVREEDARQLYDVRAVLESLAAREFVNKASDEQRARLARATRAVEEAIEADDAKLAAERKNEFYAVLIEGCGNLVLEQTLRMLQNRIRLLRGISMSSPGRLPDTGQEIRRIFEAIDGANPVEAERACKDHLQAAAAVTLEALCNRQ